MVAAMNDVNQVQDMLFALADERTGVSMPVEPDIVCKHTLYAVAWDIIRLPSRVDCTPGEIQACAQERRRIKRQCRAYAKARGYDLCLFSSSGEIELWSLDWSSNNGATHNSMFGSLQDMCRIVLENDTWPEGKPEDTC